MNWIKKTQVHQNSVCHESGSFEITKGLECERSDSKTHVASLVMRIRDVSGFDLIGGLMTCPAACLQHACAQFVAPSAATKVSPQTHAPRFRAASRASAALRLITCPTYSGHSTCVSKLSIRIQYNPGVLCTHVWSTAAPRSEQWENVTLSVESFPPQI